MLCVVAAQQSEFLMRNYGLWKCAGCDREYEGLPEPSRDNVGEEENDSSDDTSDDKL